MNNAIISEKARKIEKQSIVRNKNKIVLVKIIKILGLIDLSGRYIRAINNADINMAEN